MSTRPPIHVTLEEYSATVDAAYRSLLPAHDQRVAAGQLTWKLRDNPAGRGVVAIARADDQIVGLNAFMPVPLVVRGIELRGHQSMDTIVAPTARGQGIFPRMVDCFYREARSDFLYGFPNSQSAKAFFGQLGWSRYGQVPMLIKPLRLSFLTRRLLRSQARVDDRESQDIHNVGPAGHVPSHTTQAWERFSDGTNAAIPRTAEYLRWRLVDHPTIRYDMFSGANGAFGATSVQDKHGSRVGYLMEAIGDRTGLRDVISASIAAMRDRGAEVLFAWSLPGNPTYKALLRAGFVPFPQKLRPIEINFGARMLTQEPVSTPLSRRDWYVSYLDSDTV